MPSENVPTKKRLCLGAAVAPGSAPMLYILFVMLFLPDHTPKHERTWEAALSTLVFFFVPSSYVISYILGAPLIYMLKRLNKLSVLSVLILSLPFGAAGVIGLLVAIIAMSPVNNQDFRSWQELALSVSSGAAPPGGILGLITGLTFCLVSGMITRRDQAAPGEHAGNGGNS